MSLVGLRTEDGATVLTLRRPEALNALSEALAREFAAAARRARAEPTRVLLLQAEGPAFCAGGDLAFIERNRASPRSVLAPRMRRFYESFLSIRSVPQATVARVHGAAYGAGLCLALACDLRVVRDDARLSLNFVRLGLPPGMAAWPLARAAVGDARARELLFSGREFTGADLKAWGGACASAPDDAGLDRAARAVVRGLAAVSAGAVRALKAETGLGERLEPFLAHEARAQAAAFGREDLAEGLAALRERRAPRFR